MSVDRLLFKTTFIKGNPPQWRCPTCGTGVLSPIVDSFVFEETKDSTHAHKHEAWEPEWIEYVYSCQLKCSNPACEEKIFSIGDGTVDSYVDDDNGQKLVYCDYFRPKFFLPNLKIFTIVKNTPADIKESIEESFKLFFASPPAAGNQLRIALVRLLDNLKIQKITNKKGRRSLLTTHARIDKLPKKYAKFQNLFYAIKWLGNNGSHSQELNMDDIMDAYDIFEIVLDEIFDKKTLTLEKTVARINKNKGKVKGM